MLISFNVNLQKSGRARTTKTNKSRSFIKEKKETKNKTSWISRQNQYKGVRRSEVSSLIHISHASSFALFHHIFFSFFFFIYIYFFFSVFHFSSSSSSSSSLSSWRKWRFAKKDVCLEDSRARWPGAGRSVGRRKGDTDQSRCLDAG